jgi:hypothetical protein
MSLRFTPTPILLGCLTLALAPLAALGQSVPPVAATAAARSYDIAPGTLDQVLNRYASAAGVLLTVNSALTVGKTSGGLHGEFSLDGGFGAILSGSGLEAIGDGARGYRLAPRATDAVST